MTAAQFITDLKTIFHETTLTDAETETLVDAVIREINLSGYTLAIMTGSAGFKTFSPALTLAEEGAIQRIFRCIYASWYQNAGNTPSGSVGAITYSNLDLMSNSTIIQMIKDTARTLRQTTDGRPPFLAINEPLE
jgi:hypothetical protein